MSAVDAVVVGSGPNGLAAAVTLAGAGLSVTVVEGANEAGGGCRTESLTLPGYRHDICSIAHPLVLASPFFAQPAFAGLHGALRQPAVPFAQPLGGAAAVAAYRSVEETADSPSIVGRFGLNPDVLTTWMPIVTVPLSEAAISVGEIVKL